MFCLPLTGMKTEDFKIELTQWFQTTKQLIPHEIFSFLTLTSLTRRVNEKKHENNQPENFANPIIFNFTFRKDQLF